MTRHEAYICTNWKEHGMALVLVFRKRPDGQADYGCYVVDLWCLGVKNTFSETNVPAAMTDELLEERIPAPEREAIHPACAKKLIEGAVAYAEELGFPPHREFRKRRRVLASLDVALCPTEFTYGRNGRPCFVQGPDDSEDRVDRILARLEAKVGPEGYDFEIEEDEDSLEENDDEIDELRDNLMDFFDAEPDDVPRFYKVSGIVAASLLQPELVSPSKIMQAIWPEGRVWKDQDEITGFLNQFVEYVNYLNGLILDAISPHSQPEANIVDIWSEEMSGEDPLPLMAATKDWTEGFLQVFDASPKGREIMARADLSDHWEVIQWWASIEKEENRNRIAGAAEGTPSRTLVKSVTALARALREFPEGGIDDPRNAGND